MLVYVKSNTGQALMPTSRFGHVRKLLKTNKAKVIQACPFTIQLLYESTNHTQEVSLGIDAGSKTVGVSATTASKVLFEAEVELRNDIVSLIATRREARHFRRYRKTRYRKARFNNRKKPKGWLAPSTVNKIESHLTIIKKVNDILPISQTIVEVASFDMQVLQADWAELARPKGEGYQNGPQKGFWNAREYVLWRDGHVCQCCHGKSKDKILNVHHLESRKTGGDAPNNLATLCETCHDGYHDGDIKLPPNLKRGIPLRDAAFMGIMRWAFYNEVKSLYDNVSLTYGYLTKNTRIENKLEKEHIVDARVISGNPLAIPQDKIYVFRKVRCHNRQLHKSNFIKGGIRKSNQAPHSVHGYQLFDIVKYKEQEYILYGRRQSGYFDIRALDGTKVNKGSISYKKLTFVRHSQNYIIQTKNI